MHKTLLALLLGSTLVLLSSCSRDSVPPEPMEVSSEVTPEEPPATQVEVDKSLLTARVTIPAGFFEGLSEDEIRSSAEEADYTSYTINDDGSVTYEMPRRVYDQALVEMKTGIDDTIQEIIEGDPDIFKSVTYNSAVSDFKVRVDKAAFEADFFATWIGFSLGLSGLFYQVFAGVDTDKQKVLISFIDDATGQVFDTQEWPAEEE